MLGRLCQRAAVGGLAFTVATMAHASPHSAHPGAPHGHQADPGADNLAEILDLDAEVLAEHIASITAWLPIETSPRHIVDLGCGTGTGTFALLARFPDAHVSAVDSSADHLRRLQDKAEANGTADRVRTVQADLDAAWPELGTPDLVWASASMHHLADPGHALRRIRDLLAPGGLFALVELAGFPGSCRKTRRKAGPASRSAATPHSTATTPSTCLIAAPTGAQS